MIVAGRHFGEGSRDLGDQQQQIPFGDDNQKGKDKSNGLPV
jgi:hypothetical protein